ncbi:DUF11 domain-containing protein [Stieleria varia]|uniref:Large cysteine-rich periplasmic protein OmcB n=1 Tax=Stieleria varia TaxID=2528005 RepID=A0A5C6A5P1_9BACT|nr:DUF11 domain-containing protein [Stieleria varia]TWT94637.1 Large cysteine-rich periplasmic protein OmcB precursor [Stieleria varia]
MKAFGIRLAAGAVTILLGAIMAAQGSKDLGNGTETAWNVDSKATDQPVSPIGGPTDLDSAETWEPSAVQLVQHVEPVGDGAGFTLPSGASDGANETVDTSSAPAIGGGPQMTMGMPTFADVNDSAPPTAAPPQDAAESMTGMTPAVTDAPSNDLRGNGALSTPAGFEHEMPVATESPSMPNTPEMPNMPEMANVPSETAEAPFMSPVAMLGAVTLPGDDQPTQQTTPQSSAQMTLRSNAEPSIRLTPNGGFVDNATDPTAAAMNTPAADAAWDADAGQDFNVPAMQFAAETNLPAADTAPSTTANGFVGNNYDNGYDPTQTQPDYSAAGAPAPASMPGYPGFDSQSAVAQSQTPPYPQPGQHNGTQPQYAPAQYNAAQYDPAQYNPPQAAPTQNMAASPYGQAQPPQLPPPSYPATEAPQLPRGNSFTPVPARVASTQSSGVPGSLNGNQQLPPSSSDLAPKGPTMASPGERTLDGVQQPSVVIHKRAPEEVKVGKPASFVIHVQNVGNATALDVRVQDRVPAGMRLQDATPRPDPKYQPELFWVLGDLQAGEERTITLQLVPEQEGELGSVARVTFEAAASVRTVSTRPELKIVQHAVKQVPIGQQVEIELEISNPGSGDATNVLLQENVPDGLSHPAGRELDNLLGTLRPGEQRRQVLRMRAVEPGIVENTITVKGDDGLESTHTIAIEVISPQLQVSLTGPSRRYLERQATFLMNVANAGTDDARNVEIAVQLDRGFTFVETEYEGQYDPSRHAVFWSLPNLGKGESGQVKLTLLPVEEGERVLQVEATADMGQKATNESRVAVDSLAELSFAISDSADPIEVGGETTYEIKVNNSGSKDDSNVRVQMLLPPGLELVGNGDFQTDGRGTVAFTPKAILQANGEFVYRVKARGTAPGSHIIKAVVTSDQSKVAVTKEEATMVYADQ